MLSALLNDESVLTHPFVIGELTLGRLRNRQTTLEELQGLPSTIVADLDEVLHFVEQERLFEAGIGYVDAHLLAATRLTLEATLWTRDSRLKAAAERLDLAARVTH